MDIITEIRTKAIDKGKTLIFPETGDLRVLKACAYLAEEKICKVALIGEKEAIKKRAATEHIEMPENINYYVPEKDSKLEKYVDSFYERRKAKGLTREQADVQVRTPLYYAASKVAAGDVDGCVAGAVHTTGEVLKAAIQVIGLKKDSDVVSSIFLMSLPDGRVYSYGDCAVVPYPDAKQLASIAIDSAKTHELLTGQDPAVAMLSFSTKGSAMHDNVTLVQEALEIAKKRKNDLLIDGELQFDAAIVPAIGQKKAPGSPVAGHANVFVFPNLDAGNISYKITERLAGAIATGPIIQGLAHPMNDLSRGCSWQDVINTAAVCSLLADQ
ncbi:MAG TPA: phosphate acetyltransferase [Balneolales bacterium]|nr:phosphate acetyltransferase [Balneolales bacterium]